MKMEIKFIGPTIANEARFAWIRTKAKNGLATVTWSIGSIDDRPAMAGEFNRRCKQAGLMEKVMAWASEKIDQGINVRSMLHGCDGYVKNVPHEHVDQLLEIIQPIFQAASRGLPTDYTREQWNSVM